MLAPSPEKANDPSHSPSRPMGTPSPQTPGAPVNTAIATPKDIKEEFITQRIKSCLAKEQRLSVNESLEKFYSMGTAAGAPPGAERGIAIPCQKGYKFIPFDDTSDADRHLQTRREVLGKWSSNPANIQILEEIEALLTGEAEAEGWWLSQKEKQEILSKDTPERVKEYTEICAKARLMHYDDTASSHTYGSVNSTPGFYKYCVCRVNEMGFMTTEWACLPWSTSTDDLVNQIDAQPKVHFDDIKHNLLKRLDGLSSAGGVSDRIETMRKTVIGVVFEASESGWSCLLCNKGVPDVNASLWTPVASRNRFTKVLEEARNRNQSLLFVRERLYKFSYEIQQMERSAFSFLHDEFIHDEWEKLPCSFFPRFPLCQHDDELDLLFDNDQDDWPPKALF